MNEPFFDSDYDRIDALWDSMLERMRGDGMAQMRLRNLLATRPEFSDLSNLSDEEVRVQVARYRAEGKLPTARDGGSAENAGAVLPPAAREPEQQPARPSVQATPKVLVAAASVVTRSPATEEKRYTLLAAFNYKPTPTVSTQRGVTARLKWENEATGPETRRSGAITPSDAAFTYVRRREMRPGDYCLAFNHDKNIQKETLDLRTLKTKRS